MRGRVAMARPITYSFVCGGLCGSGGSVMFDKTAAGLKQREVPCGGWVSRQCRHHSNLSLTYECECPLRIRQLSIVKDWS
jgi:hypothetical protein